MSTEQTIVEQTDTDLDTFSAEFFGQNKTEADPAKSEEQEESTESDAPKIEDTHEETDEGETPDSETDDDLEEADEPKADKPKKNRFQERIDELTAGRREAERKAEELERRLQALEAPAVKTPEPEVTKTNNEGPSPDAVNEDGTDKYPLGEFDPQYLKDFVAFQFEQREKQALERQQAEAQQKAIEAEQTALREGWNSKLEPAQERYPDFMEKGQQLVDSLSGLDPTYSEFLSATIMSLDNGPDVLYHLASNPAEAQKIVKAGNLRAAIMLGALDARFEVSKEDTQINKTSRPKVSNAPTPPARLNKGSSAALPEVPDDTDDLDAFSSKFFKKR